MSKLKELVKPPSGPAVPPPPFAGGETGASIPPPATSTPEANLFDPIRPASPEMRPRPRSSAPWWRQALVFFMGAGLGAFGLTLYQQTPRAPAGANSKSKSSSKAESVVKPVFAPTDWVSQTLAKYQATLQLRPDQATALRGALQTASNDLHATQERASREARQAIHLVHAQLMPLLDEKQKAGFVAWRKASGDSTADDKLADFPAAPAPTAPAPVPVAAPADPKPAPPVKAKPTKELPPKPPVKPVPKAVPIP